MSRLSLQSINLGDYANDGTGDDLRTAFAKVNINFNALSNDITNLSQDTTPKLGGDLDLNGFNLKSSSRITIQSDQIVTTGTITATTFIGQISNIGNHKLKELNDVAISSNIVAGQGLVWNGTAWTSGTVDARLTGVDGGGAATIYVQDEGEFIDGGLAE